MTEEEKLSLAAVAQRLQDHIEADREFREKLDVRLDGIETKVDKVLIAFEQGKGMVKLLSWMAAAAAFLLGAAQLLKDIFLGPR